LLVRRSLTGCSGQHSFGYDDAFRIIATNDLSVSANSWSLGYDSLDRLNSATSTGTTIGYSYDANGNRLTQTGTSASSYTVSGSSNELSSVSGALSRSYSYDAAGNSLSTGATVHTYNNRGRMVTARLSGAGGDTTYIYNALGQRVKKSGGGAATTLFMYDEAGHLVGEYDASGSLIEETVWLGDIPVATLRPNGAGVDLFYVHTDQLNTPRKVTDVSNQLRWNWDPTPFGEGAPNENPASLGQFKYNLRFPGQYFDGETNLNYNYFRDYDPAVGRYVESDPIGLIAGVNTYGYVGQNPLIFVDSLGLCWIYHQSTGQLTHEINGKVSDIATGYAGYGTGLNNSAMQNVAGNHPNPSGPLPQGTYTIGTQQLNVTLTGTKLPASMRLTPDSTNQMFNRDGFLIHGPHANDQQDSSNGCPIFLKSVRDQIGSSNDKCLQVVQ